MGMIHNIGTASDRVIATLVAGLEIEFGRGAGEALAHRFVDAEDVDFFWDARSDERWLSAYQGEIADDLELDRIAICGRLDGRWFMGVMLVDGEANPHGMTARRWCEGLLEAQAAMASAR